MLLLYGALIVSNPSDNPPADKEKASVPHSLCPGAADVFLPATNERLGLRVGQRLSQETSTLLRIQDVTKIRVLEHAAIGTMELLPGRLTIYLDAENRIAMLKCG